MNRIFAIQAKGRCFFIKLLRVSIFIVLAWIGGLKAFHYEADEVVPFVANSPFMNFFYGYADQYANHKNKEGEIVEKISGGTELTAPISLHMG